MISAKIKTTFKIFILAFIIGQITLGFSGAVFPEVQAAGNSNTSNSNSSNTNGNSNTQTTVTPDGKSTAINLPTYQGVQGSVEAYLCSPSEDGGALFNCITKAYKFGIAFGAIALVFFVVLAGYFYLAGGESGKSKGKSMFISALTGMAIILGSYVLLGFINPDLLKIKPIQPPIFDVNNLPSCEEVGFGQNCILPGGQVHIVSNSSSGPGETGQCTAANLKSCTWQVNEAITICTGESGGVTNADGKADPCGQVTDGTTGQTISGRVPITVGLFQMSPDLAGENGVPECKGVLNYGSASSQADCMVPLKTLSNGMKYCPLRKCKAPKGMTALNACLNKLRNKDVNISSACSAWKKKCWQPWSTRTKLTTKTCS